MFKDSQLEALRAPLDPKHVAERSQSGRSLSYVESWHVISEANRIFGFDQWCSETVEIRQVAEFQRKIGKPPNQKDGWSVSYVARVRVTVGTVIRDGVGSGHGIDADLGQAHESAIKEAESDARKRALMTFGNPFGLALYDKSKANVQAPPPSVITEEQRVELMTLLDQLNVPVAEVLKAGKLQDLRDLPADSFGKVKSWINKRAKEMREKENAQ